MLLLQDVQESIGRDEPVETSLSVDDGDAAPAPVGSLASGDLEIGVGRDGRRFLRELAKRGLVGRGEQALDRNEPDEAPALE